MGLTTGLSGISPPLAAQTPLRYLLARIRRCGVPDELFDDATVLELLSEGYQRACERSLCLPTITSFAASTTGETALPSDHHRTLTVYREGQPLDSLSHEQALGGLVSGYYEVGETIGVQPRSGTVWLLYARRPAAFASWDSVPEAGFPPEFYYLLVHYVTWQAIRKQGGAGRISLAMWERERFDDGLRKLRRYARSVDRARPSYFRHVIETGRPRFPALARDVDAG